jgi:hypothetical protein
MTPFNGYECVDVKYIIEYIKYKPIFPWNSDGRLDSFKDSLESVSSVTLEWDKGGYTGKINRMGVWSSVHTSFLYV